jgi:hypothetical protein
MVRRSSDCFFHGKVQYSVGMRPYDQKQRRTVAQSRDPGDFLPAGKQTDSDWTQTQDGFTFQVPTETVFKTCLSVARSFSLDANHVYTSPTTAYLRSKGLSTQRRVGIGGIGRFFPIFREKKTEKPVAPQP